MQGSLEVMVMMMMMIMMMMMMMMMMNFFQCQNVLAGHIRPTNRGH